MIWLFDRRGEHLRYQIRRHGESGYELIVTYPGEHRTAEQIERPADLLEACVTRAERLRDEGWKPA
jgi:hypothetical protein